MDGLRNFWEIVVIDNFDIQESFYLEPINKRYTYIVQ